MQSHTRRLTGRMVAAVALGALAISFATTMSAAAHVSVNSNTAEAGSYAILTFSVPHGCDGSATTGISIQIPEGINAVTPTRNALYTVEKVTEDLETPITDGHGNEVVERVAEVVYTATRPLPDGYRDAFELSLQLPADAAETTLYFPTVQTCEEGEAAWVQIPADGQDPHDLDLPSPALGVTAASGSGQGHDHGESDDYATDEHASDDVVSNEPAASNDSMPLVVTSLVIGAAGLLTATAALARGRKTA